jgi:hypothetical protein
MPIMTTQRKYISPESLPDLKDLVLSFVAQGRYRLHEVEIPWLADAKYVLLTYKATCGCGHSDLPPTKFILTETGKLIEVDANQLEFTVGDPVYLEYRPIRRPI